METAVLTHIKVSTEIESSPIGILIPGIGISYTDAVRSMKNDSRFQQYCQIAGIDAGYLNDQTLQYESNDTLDTQKLSYVVNCVMCDLYKKRQIRLDYVVGYSMGIYAALYCGGYYAFETGLHILEKAFELISAYCKSTPYDYAMGLILGLTESEIRGLLFSDVGEGVDIGVYNGKRGFVIAGIRGKVHLCLQKARASGAIGVKVIRTPYPYHSPLLNHVFPSFFRFLNTQYFTVPSHKVLSPIDGDEVTVENAANVIAKALCTPLHFEKVIHVLTIDHHVQHCYETSPNKTMRNLVRYINRNIHIHFLEENAG
jgi:[acyl-carrier-protein] S-malonyltransferase